MKLRLVLDWHRFKDLDAIRKNGKVTKASGVYVLAAPSCALYVGQSIGKTGLWGRYSARGILDAALEGTRKSIYFARVPRSLVEDVERTLIKNEEKAGNTRLMEHNRIRMIPNRKLHFEHHGEHLPPLKRA